MTHHAEFEPEFLRDLKRDRKKYRSILSRLLRWDTWVPAFLLFLGGGLVLCTYQESGPVSGPVVPGVVREIRQLRQGSGRMRWLRYEFTFRGETRLGSSDLARSEIPAGVVEGSEIEIVVNPWVPSISRPVFRSFEMAKFVVGTVFAAGALVYFPFAIRGDRRRRARVRNARRCVKTLASPQAEPNPRAVIEYLESVHPAEHPYELEKLREQWARSWILRLANIWLGSSSRWKEIEKKGKTVSVLTDLNWGVDISAMERYRDMTDVDGFLRLLDSALDYVLGRRKQVPSLEIQTPDRVTLEGLESELLKGLEQLASDGEAGNRCGSVSTIALATGGLDRDAVLRNERLKFPWMMVLFNLSTLARVAEGKEKPEGFAAYGLLPDLDAIRAWKKDGDAAHLWVAALERAGVVGPSQEETNEKNTEILARVIERFEEKEPAPDAEALFYAWESALIEAGVGRGFDEEYELSLERDGERRVLRTLPPSDVLWEVSAVLFTFYLCPWRWHPRDRTFQVVTSEGKECRVRLLFDPGLELRLELIP